MRNTFREFASQIADGRVPWKHNSMPLKDSRMGRRKREVGMGPAKALKDISKVVSWSCVDELTKLSGWPSNKLLCIINKIFNDDNCDISCGTVPEKWFMINTKKEIFIEMCIDPVKEFAPKSRSTRAAKFLNSDTPERLYPSTQEVSGVLILLRSLWYWSVKIEIKILYTHNWAVLSRTGLWRHRSDFMQGNKSYSSYLHNWAVEESWKERRKREKRQKKGMRWGDSSQFHFSRFFIISCESWKKG